MSTPRAKKMVIVKRRQCINRKRVSKDLCSSQKTRTNLQVCKVDRPTVLQKGKKNGRKGKMPDSRYCSVCQEVEIRDMRQCVECCTWVHEACVGLLPDDDDTFSARFLIDIVVHYQLMLA